MSISINYTELQDVAKSLITALGSKYNLVRPSSDGSERTIAKNIPGTFDKQVDSYFNTTSGGVVASGKDTIYLPYFGKAVPQIGDRLVQGSTGWRVVNVDTIRPDNKTTILYTVELT